MSPEAGTSISLTRDLEPAARNVDERICPSRESQLIKRREFLSLLGSATMWPLAGRAQSAMPTIGYLGSETPELFADRLAAFRQGLAAAGYEERRNVAIEFRWAEGRNALFPVLAADLVRSQVAVIAALRPISSLPVLWPAYRRERIAGTLHSAVRWVGPSRICGTVTCMDIRAPDRQT